MTASRWDTVERIFHRAVEMPPERRGRFVERCCRGERALEQEVLSLIAADEDAETRGVLDRMEWPESLGRAEGAPHPADVDALPAGTRIGDAEIVRPIGAGGFGKVYLGVDRVIGRQVALKVVPAPCDGDQAATARMLREAQVIGRVRSPHIVTLFRVHPPGALAAWVFEMEYVEGGTLRDLLDREGPFEEERALAIARQMAAALADAHGKGVVHGDVKPENVLLAAGERVRLADFGLGFALDEHGVSDARVAGTPYYMAPELTVRGRPSEASDVWSFGVVLQEMLTGAVPFPGVSVPEVFRAIREDAQPDLPSPVSEHARGVVRGCLQKRAWRRPPNGAALAAALAADESSSPRPAAESTASWPIVRRPAAQQMARAFSSARGGTSVSLVVEGAAGSGKTHLLSFARIHAGREGFAWIEIRVAPGSGLLRPLAARIAKARGREVAATVPEVVRAVTEWEASRPAVFAIDGFEHADPSDGALLEHFALETKGRGSILIVATTPARPTRLADVAGASVLRLDDLSREEVMQLIEQRARTADVARVVALRIADYARGSARRAADMFEHLRQTRAIEVGRAGVIPGPAWEVATLPDEDEDLLAWRLEGLDPEDRDLLDAASVDGIRIDPPAVAAALSATPLAVLRRLQSLSRRHGLVEARNDGYEFADASCHELVSRQLPSELRAAYHRAIAEHLAVGAAAADAERLGTHWLAAGDAERARPLIAAAIVAAEQRQEIHRVLDLAVRVGLAPCPPRDDVVAAYPRAAMSVAACLADLSRSNEAATTFGVVERVTSSSHDEASYLGACIRRAQALIPIFGRTAADETAAVRAAAFFPPGEDRGCAHYVLGLIRKLEGDLAGAEREFSFARQDADDAGIHRLVSSALDQLGSIAGLRGEPLRAADLRRSAAVESLRDGRRTNATVSYVNEVIALHEAGQLEGLADRLEAHARDLLLEGARDLSHRVRIVQAHLRFAEGATLGAARVAETALAHFSATANHRAQVDCLTFLAELDGLRGDASGAAARIAQAGPLVASLSAGQYRIDLAQAQAWETLWRGRSDDAAELLSDALRQALDLGSLKNVRSVVRGGFEMVVEGMPSRALHAADTRLDDLDATIRAMLVAVRVGSTPAQAVSALEELLAHPPAERRATAIAHAELQMARAMRATGARDAAREVAGKARRSAQQLMHTRLSGLVDGFDRG